MVIRSRTCGSGVEPNALIPVLKSQSEALAKALSEHFGVPPENLVVQGYGERYLLVPQEGDIRENRRAAVRRITPLISGS